jgi:hypothetical protein
VSVRKTAPEVLRLNTKRQRRDHRGVNLISNALPFGCLWYAEPSEIDYAKHRSPSVYDNPGNVIETHEHAGEFKEP